jgi:hypothetical protein
MQGAAAKMRSYLRENGFDVVSYRNDRLQNYDETILVLRNPDWEGAKALAMALKTENVMTVYSKRAVVDASIYIGKDLSCHRLPVMLNDPCHNLFIGETEQSKTVHGFFGLIT